MVRRTKQQPGLITNIFNNQISLPSFVTCNIHNFQLTSQNTTRITAYNAYTDIVI